MEQDSLVIFEKAALMLSEANTIQQTKELKSMFLTAADWARRKGMGNEAIRYAKSYALEAERKIGEMLRETERAKGAAGNPGGRGASIVRLPDVTAQPTLSELGLSKHESAEAQKLASLPKEEFEAVKSGKKSKKAAIRGIKKKEKLATIKKIAEQKKVNPLETIIPELILADPPWRYDFAETANREIENQYPTATLDEIKKHKPETADNCILFLWATAPKLVEAMAVIEAWGFTYKTHAIWDKVKIGMGYWFRGRHELLLVATKGKAEPPVDEQRVSSIFTEPRQGHSQKPECVYQWIETTFPHLNKLEMYARIKREGWYARGNEL